MRRGGGRGRRQSNARTSEVIEQPEAIIADIFQADYVNSKPPNGMHGAGQHQQQHHHQHQHHEGVGNRAERSFQPPRPLGSATADANISRVMPREPETNHMSGGYESTSRPKHGTTSTLGQGGGREKSYKDRYSKPGYAPASSSRSNTAGDPSSARESNMSMSEEDQMAVIEQMYGNSNLRGGLDGSHTAPGPSIGEQYMSEEEQMRMIEEIYGDQLDPELRSPHPPSTNRQIVGSIPASLPPEVYNASFESEPPLMSQQMSQPPPRPPRQQQEHRPPQAYQHSSSPPRNMNGPTDQYNHHHQQQQEQRPPQAYQQSSSPPRNMNESTDQYHHHHQQQEQEQRRPSYEDIQRRASSRSTPSVPAKVAPLVATSRPSSRNVAAPAPPPASSRPSHMMVNASHFESTRSALTSDFGDGGGGGPQARLSASHGQLDHHHDHHQERPFNPHGGGNTYSSNSRRSLIETATPSPQVLVGHRPMGNGPDYETEFAMNNGHVYGNGRGGATAGREAEVLDYSDVPEMQQLGRVKPAALYGDQLSDLKDLGFPVGLAAEMGTARSVYPVRFWILDNSGSMMSNDGNIIRNNKSVQCTRWAELEESVCYHANLAGLLQATTVFRMLNDPGARCGPQEFSVAGEITSGKPHSAQAEVDQVRQVMRKCQPHGSTPLTAHLYEIGQRIASMEGTMRKKGLEAVVILATDGLPTSAEGDTSDAINDEFVQALQYLQSLPVWVVVRLCTDEAAVVNFYNELDSILELPLEVLDDFFAEAKEIYHHNKWLNYAMPLHRCRELGYHQRLFDLLDERALNRDEVKEFAALLYGTDAMIKAPDVHADWNGFLSFLGKVSTSEPPQWNPISKKMEPWISVKQLKRNNSQGKFKMFHKR